MIKILFATDQSLLAEGWALFLGSHPRLHAVVNSCTVAAAPDALMKVKPHIMIVDMQSPAFDCTSLTGGQFRSAKKSHTILLLSGKESLSYVCLLSRSGIGLLSPHSGLSDLVAGILIARQGKHFLSRDLGERLIIGARENKLQLSALFSLSFRELQVARLLASGMTSKRLACQAGISIGTVHTHRRNIFKKLNTKNVVGMINLFYEHEIGPGGPHQTRREVKTGLRS